MESIRQWVLQLTGAALLAGAVIALIPKGKLQGALRVVCGFFLAAALLTIGTDFDYAGFSRYAARYRAEAEYLTGEVTGRQDELTRSIIEAETEAYILDKGDELGMAVSAAVRAQWSEEGYWYPAYVTVTGRYTQEQRQQLQLFLEAELGLAAPQQSWSDTDEESG